MVKNFILKHKLENCDAIDDEKIKSQALRSSIFAIAKSGTISLEICNAKIP